MADLLERYISFYKQTSTCENFPAFLGIEVCFQFWTSCHFSNFRGSRTFKDQMCMHWKTWGVEPKNWCLLMSSKQYKRAWIRRTDSHEKAGKSAQTSWKGKPRKVDLQFVIDIKNFLKKTVDQNQTCLLRYASGYLCVFNNISHCWRSLHISNTHSGKWLQETQKMKHSIKTL